MEPNVGPRCSPTRWSDKVQSQEVKVQTAVGEEAIRARRGKEQEEEASD